MAKPKKDVLATIKLMIPGGQATPAPPVGPALGQHGVNIGQFIQKFNAATADQRGVTLPVVLTVYKNKTFDFVVKKPPASVLIKQAAEIAKGAQQAGREAIAQIKREKLREIAKTKMEDLTAGDIEAAVRTLEGTARSMGVEVVD